MRTTLTITGHVFGIVAFGLIAVTTVVGRAGEAASITAPPAAAAKADSVDLRPVFAKWEIPPRAQGDRPTCSVFTMTGAIEFAMAQKQRQPIARLSVEYLNWASNRAGGDPDDGSLFSDLWNGFERFGACPEEDMPYQDKFRRRHRPGQAAREKAQTASQSGLRLHWIKRWDPNKGLSDAEFEGVKDALRKGWPVCGGFLWPKDPRWKDDLLEMTPREGVVDGHSVLLVGFQDDPAQPGGGTFLIHNSGKASRVGRMSYEYVRAYANDAVWIEPTPADVAAK
ncbi:MAG: C1 family peptidase [Pirellulales bacterium]|nr:C1 family peptidase [Pirellulales bacterium]